MATQNNQVTLHFDTVGSPTDANGNSTYMVNGPLYVYATADTYDELISDEMTAAVAATIADSAYDNRGIVVYVRNIQALTNAEIIPAGSVTYRGAYYLYDTDTAGWNEILVGSHVHSNKAVLDSISSIDISALHENGNVIKVIPYEDSYRFELDDAASIPDIPSYLTTAIDTVKIDKDAVVENSPYSTYDAAITSAVQDGA